MMRRPPVFSAVFTNAGMLLLGTITRMALTFGFVVYVARYLGVTEYGKFALTQNLLELCASLCATGFCILVTREAAKNFNWLSRNLAPIGAIIIVLSGVAGVLLMVFASLAGYSPDTRMAIYIASIAIIPTALGMVAEAIFITLQKSEWVALGIAAEGIVRVALWFAVLISGYGLLSLFVVLILTRCAQLGIYWLVLARWLPPMRWRIEFFRVWTIVRKWQVFAAETCVATIYFSLDTIVLSIFWGEAAVGIYDAAYKLIRLGTVAAGNFASAIFPYISRLYVDSRDVFHHVSQQSIKYILAVCLPAVLAMTIFSDRLVVFLYDRQYAESAAVLQIVSWILIPRFLNPFLSRVLYARDHQLWTLTVSMVGLATFLALAFVLIPSFGPIGTAWTVVLSSYAALVCFVVLVMAGTDSRPMIKILARQSAATVILCVALMYLRNTQILAAILGCSLLYACLLIALQIVSYNDIKLLLEHPATEHQ
jgi:O-antigen/teichoic acid export membrane protein